MIWKDCNGIGSSFEIKFGLFGVHIWREKTGWAGAVFAANGTLDSFKSSHANVEVAKSQGLRLLQSFLEEALEKLKNNG